MSFRSCSWCYGGSRTEHGLVGLGAEVKRAFGQLRSAAGENVTETELKLF